MKFLNELAASNDRNFKFTALGSVGDHAVAAIALCTIKGLIGALDGACSAFPIGDARDPD